jgi:hypothetical protein
MAGEAEAYDRRLRGVSEPMQFMGSEPQTLAANAEYTFTFDPDYDLNLEWIRLPDALAPSLAVSKMFIGPISVMAGSAPFPGDAFKGGGTMKVALATPITQGKPLKITIRNMTTSPVAGVHVGISGRVKRAV